MLKQEHPELLLENNQSLLDTCYRKEWGFTASHNLRDASCVVEYLRRYTHRVAISNNRVLSVEDGEVSFKWQDYKDNSKWKVMTITAEEFIRRFLMHVLPKGFMKIRHYGILGNRNKTERLNRCKLLTGTQICEKELLSAIDLLKQIAGHDIGICPACGQSRLEFYMNLPPPLSI